MVRALIGLLIGLGCWGGLLGWSAGALANPLCRPLAGQQVCIETIKRSAKYFWEYRVVVSIDGDHQPLKRYDCRPSATPEETESPAAEIAIRQFVCGFVTH